MADEPGTVPEGHLVDLLGIEGFEFDGEAIATMRLPVRDGVKQPFGIVHGGAFAALSETVCSIATYTAVRPRLALGQANETIFMRAVTSGTVHARRPRPAPRQHELGLGRRDARRREAPLRDLAADHRRPRCPLIGPATRGSRS